MSDKVQLIKEEIERLKDCQSPIVICDTLLQFIDSLPEETIVKGITWKDVNTLDTLINQVRYEFPNGIGEKSFGLAVLEKFQDYQDDIEELVSEDLDRLVISLEETIGTSPHSREVIKEHLLRAAEWQKQQMIKDAVEGTIKYEIGSAEIPQCDRRYQVLSNPTPITNAKLGDKVKIVVLKTE